MSFYGNENVSSLKLKKQLKGTKEKARLTLHAPDDKSPYGTKEHTTFKEYIKNWGFLSGTKTLNYLDPVFLLVTSSPGAKFDQKKYDEDKERYCNIITHSVTAMLYCWKIQSTTPKTAT